MRNGVTEAADALSSHRRGPVTCEGLLEGCDGTVQGTCELLVCIASGRCTVFGFCGHGHERSAPVATSRCRAADSRFSGPLSTVTLSFYVLSQYRRETGFRNLFVSLEFCSVPFPTVAVALYLRQYHTSDGIFFVCQ